MMPIGLRFSLMLTILSLVLAEIGQRDVFKQKKPLFARGVLVKIILKKILTFSLPVKQHVNRMVKRTSRRNISSIHKKYFVSIFNGIESVRNNNLHGFGGKLFQNFFEQLLGYRINICSCFVKNK